jgi:DNA-binding phage protein
MEPNSRIIFTNAEGTRQLLDNQVGNDLIEALKNRAEAAIYLSAACEEGDRGIFLPVLRTVSEANSGMASVAKKPHRNRKSLSQALSTALTLRILTRWMLIAMA